MYKLVVVKYYDDNEEAAENFVGRRTHVPVIFGGLEYKLYSNFPEPYKIANMLESIADKLYYETFVIEEWWAYEFNDLRSLFKKLAGHEDSDITIDDEGYPHNETKPAMSIPEGDYWYWHGNEGLENFPPEAKKKIARRFISEA